MRCCHSSWATTREDDVRYGVVRALVEIAVVDEAAENASSAVSLKTLKHCWLRREQRKNSSPRYLSPMPLMIGPKQSHRC